MYPTYPLIRTTRRQDRIETVSDLPLACPYLFVKPDYNSKEAIDMRAKMRQKKWDVEAVLDNAITTLGGVKPEDFGNEAAVTEALHTLSQQEEVYGAALMTPLRYALTGFKVSLDKQEPRSTVDHGGSADVSP